MTKKSIVNNCLALAFAGLGFNSQAWAHNDHGNAKPVGRSALASASAQPPENLGWSSLQLLNKTIPVQSGYGRGWFYETPQNLEEELVNQGFAMMNMFQYTDGFRSFNSALAINPNSTIAQIGRALNAMNLDGSNTYYLEAAYSHILKQASAGALDAKMVAWAQMYVVLVTGQNLQGSPMDARTAYINLKAADGNNLEVLSAINWIAGVNDLNDYDIVLAKDSNHAGALHYLMHIAEGRNDHAQALYYGQRMVPLTPKSAHGQHMLGHVLPHFNRWEEADKQFEIAHQLHLDWAKENDVHPSEDWHWGHNLQLFSVTKMVFQPDATVGVLQLIEELNPGAINDTLDYITATEDVSMKSSIAATFTQVEAFGQDYKEHVQSSKLYFELVFNSQDPDILQKISTQVATMGNFKNRTFLLTATSLITAARAQNQDTVDQILSRMITQLDINFSRGGFDGWQHSVMETLMYKKVFEVYGLQDGLSRIQTEILDVYMNPNNPNNPK